MFSDHALVVSQPSNCFESYCAHVTIQAQEEVEEESRRGQSRRQQETTNYYCPFFSIAYSSLFSKLL